MHQCDSGDTHATCNIVLKMQYVYRNLILHFQIYLSKIPKYLPSGQFTHSNKLWGFIFISHFRIMCLRTTWEVAM